MTVEHTSLVAGRWGAIAILLAIAGAACDETVTSLTGPTSDLQVSFASIQSQIFQTAGPGRQTACTGCHHNVGRAPAGGLNLLPEAAYRALVNSPSHQKEGAVLVVPGDPDGSYLVQKLAGARGIVGLRMPRNGPPHLTSGQLLVIRRWIQNGALQN